MFPAKFVDLYVCPDCSRIAFLNTPGKKISCWAGVTSYSYHALLVISHWIGFFWCHILLYGLQYSDAVPGGTDSKSVVYHLLR